MSAPPHARLSVTAVTAGESPRRHVLMLHGIYGRGRNWQAIARRVVEARPDHACWLVDLRHHGASEKAGTPDTLEALAGDIVQWLQDEGVQPAMTVGHSYGGKVALALATHLSDLPLETWLIDSTPEARPPSGSAWTMLTVVRELPARFTSRAEAVAGIVAGGFSTGVAQWMATNLEREGDDFRWALDFDVMERLLVDFFATDLWAVLEQPPPGHVIHVLKASESGVISPEAVARIEGHARAGKAVRLHHLTGGHWIHAEEPDAVAALLVGSDV